MKYGIYEANSENCTTYWYFSLKDNKEAEQQGFRKVAEARTAKEASKMVNKLYRQSRHQNRCGACTDSNATAKTCRQLA